MDDYIKKRYIKYQVFDNGSVCQKTSVISRFSNGILIYTEQKNTITVFCRILPQYAYDSNLIIGEIKSIVLPKKKNFKYMCLELDNVARMWNSTIDYIITVLNSSDDMLIQSKVFAKKSSDNNIVCLFIGSYKSIEFIQNDFMVRCISFETIKPFSCSESANSASENIVFQIKKWISDTNFNEFSNEISKTVIGQNNLFLVLLSIYLYLKNVADGRTANNNVLISGPSGCGKSESFRALKRYFKQYIPRLTLCLIDTTKITSEGYIGHNTSYIIQEIKRNGSNGIGIVFLDEFDKRIIPDMNHGENVNAAIQAQLLTAVEGCMLDGVDTTKTLFVGMGSFDYIREVKAKEEKHRFGLGIENNDAVEHCDMNITREDMIRMGGLYELIGRFSCVINYGSLSEEAIDKIVDIRLEEISAEIDIPVSVSDDMRAYLHANSNTPFGNRLIYSILRESVNKALLYIYTNNITLNEIELVITGKEEYVIKPVINESKDIRKALEDYSLGNRPEDNKVSFSENGIEDFPFEF